MTQLAVNQEFLNHFESSNDFFDQMLALKGKVYRQLENRQTLEFNIGGKAYFIKKHFGVGWREIFKNVLQGKKPILGANNERVALEQLKNLGVGVPEVQAFGMRGCNPAKRQSFIVTSALSDTVDLEELWVKQKVAQSDALKSSIIKELARIMRIMHGTGINHRDCYMCHFLLARDALQYDQVKLSVIDLHRAQMRRSVPERWLIKDLAGLYFSAMDAGLIQKDFDLFLTEYFSMSMNDVRQQYSVLINKIEDRAIKLYTKEHGKQPDK